MSVGIPGITTLRRRNMTKAPTNPMDVATVFSILPKEIKEVKYTLDPGVFELPAGKPEAPSRLLVRPASWWKDVDPDEPLIEIPTSSVVIAKSIVQDYCNGILLCNMGDHMPGLFWIPGDISVADLKVKHTEILAAAIEKQNNWFRALIKLGDSLWARTNGNPLSISDDSRLAAKMMQVGDRPWLQDFKLEHLINCPACGTLRNNNFPVCSNCKVVVDAKRFEELGLKFAS